MTADRGEVLLRRVLAGADAAAGVDPFGSWSFDGDGPLRHVARVPARDGDAVPWPDWVPPEVRAAFLRRGVRAPWRHQAEAASLAHAGRDVVVATGTASGKSLAYQLPVLSRLAADPRATALYLSPTKALAADQLRALAELDLPGVRAAALDGDTAVEERDWARAHSRWIFSNPDMLHRAVLPRHARWATFLRRLHVVVVDECHTYRGVFGSHVALLLRRLLRVAARYGSHPTVVLASATVAEPAAFASRLTGRDVTAVTVDGSPHAGRTVALWEPPLLPELTGENGAPVRRPAGTEAARMLADLVIEGARTLAFVRSRRGAELTALGARRLLADVDPDLAARVAAYRGGYLPEERRALEAALASGALLGVATTNALELGVDIAGLDAVVVAGFPGTRASFWQQAGRAGRATDSALVVLVARDDPMDTYLVHHPEALLGRPVEGCVLDPTNPYVLAPQLVCAAAELPLTQADVDGPFGGAPAAAVLEELVADGVLRRRPTGWFWPSTRERPAGSVDIRGSGLGQVAVVEAGTGRMLGTADAASAPATLHPGAIHLHRGESHLVEELDLDAGVALVVAADPGWRTDARSTADVQVVRVLSRREHGPVGVGFAEVDVSTQVVAYQRRAPDGTVLETVPLDMPEQTLRTRSVFYDVDDAALAAAGIGPDDVPGALHAAEHAAIGLLPLFAICDRWDIGGMSTALHPHTGRPTVFVHDGHPGGAGFAERGHQVLGAWLTATRSAIRDCGCRSGCPSCVQSPKCGNGNAPLDKRGAVAVLDVVLAALSGPSRSGTERHRAGDR
ncbi:DEAD/DEAH box helicase [Pseudonocardia petroleophila]|uniref:DEAD/DEAH box helicase n=1 Tax=Pseudonocardia petroleophila TaxID=37331 RepID=UPI0021024D38|nr:DEAD/DEAH box helicase [Pseudonocardia petroleophila]